MCHFCKEITWKLLSPSPFRFKPNLNIQLSENSKTHDDMCPQNNRTFFQFLKMITLAVKIIGSQICVLLM